MWAHPVYIVYPPVPLSYLALKVIPSDIKIVSVLSPVLGAEKHLEISEETVSNPGGLRNLRDETTEAATCRAVLIIID